MAKPSFQGPQGKKSKSVVLEQSRERREDADKIEPLQGSAAASRLTVRVAGPHSVIR